MPTVPRDGTLVQGSNGSTPVAAIVGTARVNFASPQEVVAAGYGTDWASKVRAIPARAFNEIRTGIIDGTRIGRAGEGSQAAVVGGAVVAFASEAELAQAGYADKLLYWVPPRIWNALPTTIADGTRIKAPDSSAVWLVTAGRRSASAATAPVWTVPARVVAAIPLA